MKRLCLLFLLLASTMVAAQVYAPVEPAITSSGGTLTVPNMYGAMNVTFEEIPSGSPATVSVTIQGCMRGGTCDSALDTNTSTSAVIRSVTPTAKVYNYFLVTASWTGGTNVSIQVNPVLTTARAGGNGSTVAAAPLCDVIGSGDTLTAAGTFATSCTTSGLTAGTFLEIIFHGVLSTTATASPVEAMQVNAGGTTGLCNHGTANNSLNISITNDEWEVVCRVHILTAGAPGTATAWGTDIVATSDINGQFASKVFPQHATTQSFNSATSQAITLQLVSTLVSGQSFTLQSLIVRNY